MSVLIPTYQHVDFVEDALRGALGQDTDFAFEVIVRDDGSADGTADRVRSVAERFPNIVRAVLETQNRWVDVSPLAAMLPLARGEFVATCEGDDHWFDPRKLAKQVAALLDDPTAVLSWHDYLFVADGIVVHRRGANKLRSYSSEELVLAPGLRLNSLCFRNVLPPDDHPAFRHVRVSADRFLIGRLGLHGGAAYTGSVLPNVYRIHHGGAYSGLPEVERRTVGVVESLWRGRWFADHGRPDVAAHLLDRAAREAALLARTYTGEAGRPDGGDGGRLVRAVRRVLRRSA